MEKPQNSFQSFSYEFHEKNFINQAKQKEFEGRCAFLGSFFFKFFEPLNQFPTLKKFNIKTIMRLHH